MGSCEGAFGVALGDGTEDEVGDAVGHLVVGVDDAAPGDDDIDGAPNAGIGWNEVVGIDDHQPPHRGLLTGMVIE